MNTFTQMCMYSMYLQISALIRLMSLFNHFCVVFLFVCLLFVSPDDPYTWKESFRGERERETKKEKDGR